MAADTPAEAEVRTPVVAAITEVEDIPAVAAIMAADRMADLMAGPMAALTGLQAVMAAMAHMAG